MLDLIATGYTCVDTIVPVSHCPPANDTAILATLPEEVPHSFGGCAANVTVGMNRLGHRTGMATLLGADEPGRAYLAHLQAEGVDTRDVQLVATERTARSFLLCAPDGEYQIFYYPGVAPTDWQGEFDFSTMAEARYALVTAGPLHFCCAFIDAASKHDVPLIWQLKTHTSIYPDEVLHRFWKQSFMIMMNAGESLWLCERLGAASPQDLLRGATSIVIVTEGAEGATLYVSDQAITHVPSVPLADTYPVGAGDAFTAGFLDGFLQDADWVECTRRGVTLATFALSQPGAHSGLPDRATYWKQHLAYWSQE